MEKHSQVMRRLLYGCRIKRGVARRWLPSSRDTSVLIPGPLCSVANTVRREGLEHECEEGGGKGQDRKKRKEEGGEEGERGEGSRGVNEGSVARGSAEEGGRRRGRTGREGSRGVETRRGCRR
eukprot:2270540-Rhodomonas_salina.1